MTTIPRAEIHAIGAKYGDDALPLATDPSAELVRSIAAGNRDAVKAWGDVPYGGTLLAEADDLDALVDRIEREAA
jgi:hypothetical protein